MLEKFIHIGLHKTGSTFLQKVVFKNIERFNYVQNGKVKHFVGAYNKLLISNEAFSGVPYKKGNGKYFDQFQNNIKKLKAIFGDFKVIVGFRQPSSIAFSLYKQYLHEGGTRCFDEFFNNTESAIINSEDLKFSKFYKYLESDFGKGNFFAYDQRDLLLNEELVLGELEKFLGEKILKAKDRTKRNSSVPDNLITTLRTLNIVDAKISNYGFSLNNRIFKKIGIDPRNLCQNVLPNFLPNGKKRDFIELNGEHDEDWKKIKSSLSNFRN